MINIKKYLNSIGVNLTDLAPALNLSRPTLNSYIKEYEKNGQLPREKYNIIFKILFSDETMSRKIFDKQMERIISLLERDERLGTNELSPEGSDVMSDMVSKIYDDLSTEGWDENVYRFIGLLIKSYRSSELFHQLVNYFCFLNYFTDESDISDAQKAYMANYYYLFNKLSKEELEYCIDDYEQFISRCKQIKNEKSERRKIIKNKLSERIDEIVKNLQDQEMEVSEENIINELQRISSNDDKI